jgi:hypothetical protein
VKRASSLLFAAFIFFACKKDNVARSPSQGPFNLVSASVNNVSYGAGNIYNVNTAGTTIRVSFSAPINKATVASNVSVAGGGLNVPTNYSYANGDSSLIMQPSGNLKALTVYGINISIGLQSTADSSLKKAISLSFVTAIDSTDKFTQISDSALLDLVQSQTLKYFYDFGHSVSGLALERNTSGNTVTTGGSGFGIMAMLAGAQRNFITRSQAFARIDTIVNFLTNKAIRYHGAFPHWMDGSTGATIPFGTQDDGADLVETSYMMQGLLTARQYFNSATDAGEISLRSNINSLWNGVDWGWFRQNNQNTLFWHWSPDFNWSTNQQINGWNEALIAYVLAASANIDSVPKIVYDNGWARN